jgi:hypothetical protein
MELSAVPIYRGGTEGSATWQKDWNALGSHSTEHCRSLAEVDDALYAAKPTMLAIESVSGPARGPIFATAWTGKGNVRLVARRPAVRTIGIMDPWPVLPAGPCWLRDLTHLCFIPGAHPGVIFACNTDAISALDLLVGPIQRLEKALFLTSKATPHAKEQRERPEARLQRAVIGPCREHHRHSAQHVQGHREI